MLRVSGARVVVAVTSAAHDCSMRCHAHRSRRESEERLPRSRLRLRSMPHTRMTTDDAAAIRARVTPQRARYVTTPRRADTTAHRRAFEGAARKAVVQRLQAAVCGRRGRRVGAFTAPLNGKCQCSDEMLGMIAAMRDAARAAVGKKRRRRQAHLSTAATCVTCRHSHHGARTPRVYIAVRSR